MLERKICLVVTHEREKGQALDRRFNLEDAEPAPSGPDTAKGINELLSVNFGSEFYMDFSRTRCAWCVFRTAGVARQCSLGQSGKGQVVISAHSGSE